MNESMRQQQRPREQGVALIVVLSITALLTAVVIGLQSEVARDMASLEGASGRAAARRMAEVGVAASLILLQYDAEEDQRSRSEIDFIFKLDGESGLQDLAALSQIRELWSLFQPGGTSPLMMMGLGGNFLPLGDDGGVELTIEDQSAKWNPHRLLRPQGVKMDDPEVQAAVNGVATLLDAEGRARGIVAAMIDWMDADDQNVDPAGAETLFYRALQPPYEARNAPFEHLGELRSLRGVDEETYDVLVSGVTVWPNNLKLYSHYKLNVNTASAEALTFLEPRLDFATAERIVQERDVKPFENIAQFRKFVVDDLGLKKVAGKILDFDNVTVQSSYFLVRATGYQGDKAAQLEAVIERNPATKELRVLMRRWLTLS